MRIAQMFLFYVLLSFYVNAEKNGKSNSTSVQEEFIEPRNFGDECKTNDQCRIKTKNSICGHILNFPKTRCICGNNDELNLSKTACVLMLPTCSNSENNENKEQRDCKDKKQFCQNNRCYCRGPYEYGIIGINGTEDVKGCWYPHLECYLLDNSNLTVLVKDIGCFSPALIGELCEHTEQCETSKKHSFCDLSDNTNSSYGVCKCLENFIYHKEKAICQTVQEFDEEEKKKEELRKKIIESEIPNIPNHNTDLAKIQDATTEKTTDKNQNAIYEKTIKEDQNTFKNTKIVLKKPLPKNSDYDFKAIISFIVIIIILLSICICGIPLALWLNKRKKLKSISNKNKSDALNDIELDLFNSSYKT